MRRSSCGASRLGSRPCSAALSSVLSPCPSNPNDDGGSVWESNPPPACLEPDTGFEVREAHRVPRRFRCSLSFSRLSVSLRALAPGERRKERHHVARRQSQTVVGLRVVHQGDARKCLRDAESRDHIGDGAAVPKFEERGIGRAIFGKVAGEGGEESDFDPHLVRGWAFRAAATRTSTTSRSPGRILSGLARLFQRRRSAIEIPYSFAMPAAVSPERTTWM